MKNNITLTSVLAMFCFGFAFAQSNVLWTMVDDSEISADQWDRTSTPEKYSTFNLDIDALFAQIENAPNRKLSRTNSGVVVTFPMINGDAESYEVFDAPVIHEELQAEHPDMRSFIGVSLREPSKLIRFSITLFGLRAVILNAKGGTQYIDCLTKDRQSYIMYFKKDVPTSGGFDCLVDESEFTPIDNLNRQSDNDVQYRNATDGRLREFRLALTCTSQVTTFYVNQAGVGSANDTIKKTVTLSALLQIMTRINAVYEIEMGITMIIIPDNRDIIFINEPDGLTNTNLSALLDENQVITDALIGSVNYDIGHVLCTASGGLAQLFSPCTANKARGASGTFSGQPQGFEFEGIIMHEMGHQYGAFHTWSAPSCAGTYTDFSATEPGSGTTIMSYAGICGGSANIQGDIDTYFHQISIDQMWANITVGNSICANQSVTSNAEPVVDAGPNFIIPRGTPYKLTGTATDDGDLSALTYTWEQIDIEGPEALPTVTTVEGPVVRSFPPTTENFRYIPRLEDYVNQVNFSTQWENLMQVDRTMNFAFTARDNDAAVGQTNTDFMTVTLSTTAGPFTVSSQNLVNTVYDGGTTQTVTWDVANTNTGAINSPNVNILLSVDGGLTFDTVLLNNTPNDGSQDVLIPNVNSTTCRIMVESANNIFYNINVRDFEVRETVGLDEQSLEDSLSIFPNPNSGQFNVKFNGNVTEDFTIEVFDIRGRSILSKQYDPTNEFNEVINLNAVQSGVYLLNISSGESMITRKLVVN